MTAATVTSFEGVLWRHSAPAAAPLWVALQLRSKNRLAATVLAAICAFALTLTAAPQVTSVSLFGSETGVAAQTDPTHALVGVETPVSPTAVGGNGAHSYDGVSGCCVAPQAPSGGKRNHLRPDDNAVGSHSTFRTDADGNVTHYATWDPNPYPQYPKPWVQQKRVDVVGDPHVNKITGKPEPTPHVQGRDIPGGVRPPRPDELPEWAR